jgi:hypothetical protein
MSAVENEETLASLRRQAEDSQRRYLQVLGQINAKKSQLAETMAALTEMGCGTLDEAEAMAESLRSLIEERMADIRRLLA